jgi:hypothetical protein
MMRVLSLNQRVKPGTNCTKWTDSASGVAKVDRAKRAPGDSWGVPLSLLSDPLSHCKYMTYSRVIRD